MQKPLRLLGMLLVLPCALPARGQPPRNVLDYASLLPASYFPVLGSNKSTAGKRQMLRKDCEIDIPHGYLHLNSDGQPNFTVAIFKAAQGDYVMGVGSNERNAFDPYLAFYAYRRGSLIEVTHQVLPIAYQPELNCFLPRIGRTIRIQDKSGKSRGTLQWNGREFQASP